MKKNIEKNFEDLKPVENKIKICENIKKECETVLNQTFFSEKWKALLNPVLWVSIFFEIYLRETISHDASTVWYWINVCFGIVSFIGISSATIIYFRWIYTLREIKILKTEIEYRLKYIRNLLDAYEKHIKSVKNEQT